MLGGQEGSAQKGQMEYRLTRGFCCNCFLSTFDSCWAPSYVFLDGDLDTQPLPQPVCIVFALYEVMFFLENILIRNIGDKIFKSIVLDWPKCSFRLFVKMLSKNPNECFGQPR